MSPSLKFQTAINLSAAYFCCGKYFQGQLFCFVCFEEKKKKEIAFIFFLKRRLALILASLFL